MQTTIAAVNLIKAFEGFEPSAYLCSGGKWTIGWGTTRFSDGEPVQIGDGPISHAEAEEMLQAHLRREVEPVLDDIFPGALLDIGTRDALASFIFNIGPNWKTAWPTLRQRIEQGDKAAICDQVVKYKNASGRPLLGLYRRRLAEACMIQGWPWEFAQSATWDTKWQHLAPELEPSEIDPIPDMPHREPEPAPPVLQPDLEPEPVTTLPARKPVSVHAKRAEEWDLPPDPRVKPIEHSRSVEGYTHEREGERWLDIVRVAFPSGIGMTGVAFLSENSVWETLALATGGVIILGAVAEYRRRTGRAMKEQGRQEASTSLR